MLLAIAVPLSWPKALAVHSYDLNFLSFAAHTAREEKIGCRLAYSGVAPALDVRPSFHAVFDLWQAFWRQIWACCALQRPLTEARWIRTDTSSLTATRPWESHSKEWKWERHHLPCLFDHFQSRRELQDALFGCTLQTWSVQFRAIFRLGWEVSTKDTSCGRCT